MIEELAWEVVKSREKELKALGVRVDKIRNTGWGKEEIEVLINDRWAGFLFGELDKEGRTMFPTCCGVCWGGYLLGVSSGDEGSTPKEMMKAQLKLVEDFGIRAHYAAIIVVGAEQTEEQIEFMKAEGWVPSEEMFNTAHGKEEASGESPRRLIIWYKNLTEKHFKKWRVKPKAKARTIKEKK